MNRMRSIVSAAILFVGVAGSMGTLGYLIFEEALVLGVYSAGVVAGASWLSVGAYKAERSREA